MTSFPDLLAIRGRKISYPTWHRANGEIITSSCPNYYFKLSHLSLEKDGSHMVICR